MERKVKRVVYTTSLFQYIIDIIKKSCFKTGDNANEFLEKAITEYVDKHNLFDRDSPRTDTTEIN